MPEATVATFFLLAELRLHQRFSRALSRVSEGTRTPDRLDHNPPRNVASGVVEPGLPGDSGGRRDRAPAGCRGLPCAQLPPGCHPVATPDERSLRARGNVFGLDQEIASLASGRPVIALAVALLLGLRHPLDPDHLAAVAAMARDSRRRSALIGLSWGAGHATTVLALGVPVVLWTAAMPKGLHQMIEALVGVMIFALGLRLLVQHRRGELHAHPHRPPRSLREAYAVGVVHGAGGSAAIGLPDPRGDPQSRSRARRAVGVRGQHRVGDGRGRRWLRPWLARAAREADGRIRVRVRSLVSRRCCRRRSIPVLSATKSVPPMSPKRIGLPAFSRGVSEGTRTPDRLDHKRASKDAGKFLFAG